MQFQMSPTFHSTVLLDSGLTTKSIWNRKQKNILSAYFRCNNNIKIVRKALIFCFIAFISESLHSLEISIFDVFKTARDERQMR